ncbi:MAG: hypothetical protein ACHQD9_04390 [Chitinophagales bacterium]
MKKFFLIPLFSLLSSTTISAQNNFPFLKLDAASFGISFIDPGNQSLSFEQISAFAKDASVFTPLDLSGYSQGKLQIKITENGNIVFESPTGPVDDQKLITSTRFDAQASFNIFQNSKNDYAKHEELRFGLFYQPYQFQQANYLKTEKITDDSVVYNYAYYDAWTPLAGIDGAFLLRTPTEKWISAYAGLGFSAGFSIHPQTSETHGVVTSKMTSDSSSGMEIPVYHFRILTNTQNIFPGKSSFLLEGKIPLGVNFRLYKELFVFAEGNLTISKQFFIGAPSPNQGLSFAETVGVRVRI